MKRNSWCNLVLSAVAAVLLCATSTELALGQGGFTPAKAAAPTPSPAQQALSDAWKAFYDGHYDDAAKLAAPLVKSDESAVRLQATHLYARAKWSSGTKSGRAEAQRAWEQVAKTPGMSDATRRAALAKVLLMDAEAKRDSLKEAIASLETLTKQNPAGTATAEVDIELCRLYVLAGRYDDAQTLLESVAAYLKKLNKLELTVEEARPFLTAAQKALSQLKYERDAGRASFEKAQKLQKAKQFKEATEVYASVAQSHPESDYTVQSQFCIGECMRDMGRPADALKQWNQFVKVSPSGPWRGQALIGLLDLYLEQSFDLKAAKTEAVTAYDQMRAGLAGEKSGPSWREAAYELYIRVGAIAALEGRYPGAALAFKEAAASLSTPAVTGSKSVTAGLGKTGPDAAKAASAAPSPSKVVKVPEGLALLISMTESSQSLTPADIGKPDADDRAALTLALGRVYFVANLPDHAQSLFDRLLDSKAVAALTPAQKAYAQFSQALLQEDKKPDDAKASYLASIKTCPSASWCDETLFRLATMIQREADKAYEAHIATTKQSDDPPPMKPLTKADREKHRQLQAALTKARCEALPYWQELFKRYPQSPRAEPALYSTGLLQCGLAEIAPADKSEAIWKEAVETLNRFCESYPDSIRTGEAYAKVIDIALEQFFDPALAQGYADKAVAWASSRTIQGQAGKAEGVRAAGETSPDLTFKGINKDEKNKIIHDIFGLYMRAGFAAYLAGKNDLSKDMFRTGDSFDFSDRKKLKAETAMVRMTNVVAGSLSPLTPPEAIAMATDGRQKVALQIADLYLLAFEPAQAEDLYERLLDGGVPFPRANDGLEAYLIFRDGQSLEFQMQQAEALQVLARLFDKKYAKFSWVADGIFRLGTWTYNANPKNAAEAMKDWRYVATNFTKHPEAERSLFYYGQTAAEIGKMTEAIAAYKEYLEKYPNSRWSTRIAAHELPAAEAKLKEAKQ